jgi:hypothetical protein
MAKNDLSDEELSNVSGGHLPTFAEQGRAIRQGIHDLLAVQDGLFHAFTGTEHHEGKGASYGEGHNYDGDVDVEIDVHIGIHHGAHASGGHGGSSTSSSSAPETTAKGSLPATEGAAPHGDSTHTDGKGTETPATKVEAKGGSSTGTSGSSAP